MKTLLCSLVLCAALVHSAVLEDKSTPRYNLNIGGVYPGDRLLDRSYLIRPAVANTIQSGDYVFRGNASTRISAILATEQGYTQWGLIWVINGGLGYSNVTLRAQSQRGYGYYYLIDVWGR